MWLVATRLPHVADTCQPQATKEKDARVTGFFGI